MPEPTVPLPRPALLVSEAHGRREVPLHGLPSGIIAVTVPRTRKDGDEVLTRVPVDRKRRVNPAVVDLIASDPVPAYDPPAGLTDRDLIKVLTTRTRKRWTTIEADFGQEQAWRTTVSLIRCGAVVLRCKVVQTTGFTPTPGS